MHPTQFASILDETVASIRRLSTVKGGEYATDADRLANFKEAARRLNLLPEQVLLVYLDKHYAAVRNRVNDMSRGVTRPESEPIEGRADDMIVYLMLFKALLAERRDVAGALRTETRLTWDEEE
jgi:hypothetical protein